MPVPNDDELQFQQQPRPLNAFDLPSYPNPPPQQQQAPPPPRQRANNNNNRMIDMFLNNVRFFLDSPQTRKHIADIGIRPLLDDTVRFISRNPRATTGIGIVCLFLSMPFILFVLFAMCTLMVTFTGFLIVEGALITFASVLLFTFVGAMLLTGICGATAVTAAYFGCHFVYRMVDYHRRTAGAAGHNGGGGDGADRGGAAANDVG